jgi:hypothetical protein
VYDPAVWLGLSHLHTVRGVELSKVSVAAVAAALPKLHTLGAFGPCDDRAEAATFFTELLPRLRVFHFSGRWPDVEQPATTAVAPLPLLQELEWSPFETVAPREFLGAQPTALHAPDALISQQRCHGADDASASFLARVSELRVTIF